jgi:proteasome accessory factor A
MMVLRVYGEETEYGCCFVSDSGVSYPLTEHFIDTLIFAAKPLHQFISNGGRLYQDILHVEYATPECLSPVDVVKYSKAGERLLDRIARSKTCAIETGSDKELEGRVRFFRNNVDTSLLRGGGRVQNTFGCHENYSFDPRKFIGREGDSEACENDDPLYSPAISISKNHAALQVIYEHMLPFLITRYIWAGSGDLVDAGGVLGFQLSQRIPHIDALASSLTTSQRPIFNWRDNPKSGFLGRLHVICGDANMSEYASLLKFGATGIVLGMIEDGFCFDDLTPVNGIHMLHTINRTMDFGMRFDMRKGSQKSALDIQKAYLERAKEWVRDRPDEDASDLIDIWEETLDMLKDGDPALERRLDWAAKRSLIVDSASAAGKSGASLKQMNLQYHDIDRTRGLYYFLVQNGLMDTFLERGEVNYAAVYPPKYSRARMRQELVSNILKRKREGLDIDITSLTWDEIEFCITVDGKDHNKRMRFPSPFFFHEFGDNKAISLVDKMISEIESSKTNF